MVSTSARRRRRLLGREGLRADEHDVRAAAGEGGLHVGVPPKTGSVVTERVAVDLEVDVVGEHRCGRA